MSREHGPSGESEPQISPFDAAVNSFNRARAASYKGIDVADAYGEVVSVGIREIQDPLELYSKLLTIAGQAAELAESNSDTEYVTRFRGEQQGFQRTIEMLSPKPELPVAATAPSTPTAPKAPAVRKAPTIRRATGRAAG